MLHQTPAGRPARLCLRRPFGRRAAGSAGYSRGTGGGGGGAKERVKRVGKEYGEPVNHRI